MTQPPLSPHEPTRVYHAFSKQALDRPDAPALIFPDLTFTYARFDRLVRTFAHKFQNEFGVDQNSLLILQSSEMATVLGVYLAASALGAAVVERNDSDIVPAGYQLTHHFHTGVTKSSYPANSVRIDQEWSPARYPDVRIIENEIDENKPFQFNFSSGTTGLPKIIPLSHRTVLKRSLAAHFDFKPEHTRFATLLTVGFRPFMARALAALVNGATILDGTDPIFWIEKGATLVSGSVKQMVSKFDRTTLPVKIREAEVLGARLSWHDARLLLRSFEEVQDAIGASEASKFYVNVHKLNGDTHIVQGRKLDTDVEIIDVLSGQVTETEEGVLRVRNPYLASGYIDAVEEEANTFRDGWFYTGDTARWKSNGVLDIGERTNNVINIGGTKIHAGLIDRVLSTTRGIRDAVAFKNPKPDAKDEVFAFVVFEDGINQLQAAEVAKLRVEELLGNNFVPRVIRGVAGLPRLSDGTADRKACADFILELSAAKQKSNH